MTVRKSGVSPSIGAPSVSNVLWTAGVTGYARHAFEIVSASPPRL
jgi:hypothetical protein